MRMPFVSYRSLRAIGIPCSAPFAPERATDALNRQFRAQAGDVDQIVLRASHGRVSDSAVRGQIATVLASVAHLPHVSGVVSPLCVLRSASPPDRTDSDLPGLSRARAGTREDRTLVLLKKQQRHGLFDQVLELDQ